MRAAAVLLVLALAIAVGASADRAARPAAVDARAQSIRNGDGSLLAAREFGGRARLVWVRPLSLRRASKELLLREDFVSEFALSPDRTLLAVGSEMHSSVELIDLRRWRSLGAVRLGGPRSGGYGGASGLVWASERRLLALAGPFYTRASPVVVDPLRRRVVERVSWRGAAIRSERAGKRLIVLTAGRRAPGGRRARLVSFDSDGRLREMRLSRIRAGSWPMGRDGVRVVEPGLAVTTDGRRAYVVGADARLVAEVDVGRWRVTYHEVSEVRSAWRRIRELIEPAAHAKGPIDSAVRTARVLPNGVIAVSGEDQEPTEDAHEPKTVPFGVRLIDPESWTVRTVDADAQDVMVAGGTLLARRWYCNCTNALPPIGLRAYDTAGEPRFTRFAGAGTLINGAAGGHAYVEVGRGSIRRLHVIDLDDGETVRVLPRRRLRLLNPSE